MKLTDLTPELMDAVHVNIIMSNARRIACPRLSKVPNWQLAMETFGLGSTYAHRLCHQIGLDPDSRDSRAVFKEAKP